MLKSRKMLMAAILTVAILVITAGSFMYISNGSSSIQKINTYEAFAAYYSIPENTQWYLKELASEGYSEEDIRIAYAFLNDQYGKKEDLVPLLTEAANGLAWETIFTNYNDTHNSFIPRAYDSEYLDQIMQSENITSDDIMICDRLSFASGQDFNTLMMRFMEGENWEMLSEELGIINSQRSLIRVPVTTDDINLYTQSYGLSENQVVEGFVLAAKFDMEVEGVLVKLMSGDTEEKIMAYYLEAIFGDE